MKFIKLTSLCKKGVKNNDMFNILTASNDYFIDCLENSPEAKEAREYIKRTSQLQSTIMKNTGFHLFSTGLKFGFIPSQEQLKNKLKDKFTEEQIEKSLKLNNASLNK